MNIAIEKTETLYAACSPERGVICYGNCQDEAINNLADEIHYQDEARQQSPVGDRR